MVRRERTGDATIGGRMDEDELLAIATEEGFGDEEQPQQAEQAGLPEEPEPPERQQPSRH